MVVLGIGVGLFTAFHHDGRGVTALDPSRSSASAGGLVYMFQVAGGAVGLGLTTTVFVTASEDSLQKNSGEAGSTRARGRRAARRARRHGVVG